MIVNFLEPSSDFQTSVNIGYDLNNKKKVESFIPTSSAVSLLETILLSTDVSSTNRAHILVGAYGKGKSHIILSILSLLYSKDETVVSRFLQKTAEINYQLYEYAVDYIHSEKRLLPVVIGGNSASLTQAFLRSLYATLKEKDLLSVMPETNYQMALKMIDLWRKDYPEVYARLQDALIMPVKEFEHALAEFKAEAYSTFEKIYPSLTAGNEFNPLSGYDVVELYESVCAKLKPYGYSGIYVVYDEFSKYLESSISKASINDIKMLQDFAEKCNRSGESQLHLLLISHKEIENYIDVLPKQKVDGWRGVSERFSHIVMQSDYAQTYEILGTAIRKNDAVWKKFKVDNASYFQSLVESYRPSALFSDCSDNQLLEAVVECYPLHPITTFLLPRISEKVAQNERTLFTFVAGQDKASLSNLRIASNCGVPSVTPDYLYDYFAPQMRKEVFTSEVHQLYTLTNEILQGLEDNSLEAKLVKTISLIYCVGQHNTLAPTVETLVKAYASEDVSVDEIRYSIDSLIRKRLVVYLKRSNAFLQLKRSSGVDIYAEIKNAVEKRKGLVKPEAILNAANIEPYLYPIRYNDERSMTRYFVFRFLPLKDLVYKVPKIDALADGLVIGVIPDEGELTTSAINDLVEKYRFEKQILLVVPDELSSIEKELRMFDAVGLLRNDLLEDQNLKNEYDIIYQDLLELINQYVAQFIHPALHGAQYWHEGKRLAIYRKSQLTAKLSSICDEVFPNTPTINNEIINRNQLTSIAVNSRTKLLEALMQKDLPYNLGLVGSGQDVSFMRSTLIVPGLLTQDQRGGTLTEKSTDNRLTDILSEITSFFEKTKKSGAGNFADLYQILTGTSKGFGIRKGIIPVFIAVCLRKYHDHFVIWNQHEEEKLTPALLNQINEDPGRFTIRVEEWTDEKEAYTRGLADAFSDFIIEKEKQYGTYSYIALAMNRWFLSLPKYVKDIKQLYKDGEFFPIEKENRSFLNLLKQPDTGAQNMLFVRIPSCFGFESVSGRLLSRVIDAKRYVDRIEKDLEEELIVEVKRIFGDGGNERGLAACVTRWVDSLSTQSKNKLYSDGAERIIPVLSDPGNDEYELINRIARIVSGLRIDDWNDKSISGFLSRLKQYKETIDAENSLAAVIAQDSDDSETADQYSVTFIDQEGKAKHRTFQRTECSRRAKLLLNRINSDLRDMGHAITQEEKRQVLMEILESLC